jgi:hypothetical protein
LPHGPEHERRLGTGDRRATGGGEGANGLHGCRPRENAGGSRLLGEIALAGRSVNFLFSLLAFYLTHLTYFSSADAVVVVCQLDFKKS